MKLNDILTLCRSGYKIKDIQEMERKEAEEAAQAEPEKEEPKEIEKEEPKEESKEVEPDYKKLYEDSQKALQAAQKDNVRKQSNPDQETDEDILSKLFS